MQAENVQRRFCFVTRSAKGTTNCNWADDIEGYAIALSRCVILVYNFELMEFLNEIQSRMMIVCHFCSKIISSLWNKM